MCFFRDAQTNDEPMTKENSSPTDNSTIPTAPCVNPVAAKAGVGVGLGEGAGVQTGCPVAIMLAKPTGPLLLLG